LRRHAVHHRQSNRGSVDASQRQAAANRTIELLDKTGISGTGPARIAFPSPAIRRPASASSWLMALAYEAGEASDR